MKGAGACSKPVAALEFTDILGPAWSPGANQVAAKVAAVKSGLSAAPTRYGGASVLNHNGLWSLSLPIAPTNSIDSPWIRGYNGLADDHYLIATLSAWETMEPYTLLVIARTQSLAKRLRGALGAEQYVIRWASSSAQALKLDLYPALLILDLPPSGGVRSVARLKRRFDAPLVALFRAGQSVSEQVDGSLPRSCPTQELAELIEITLINHSPHMICVNELSLDVATRRLQINGTVHQLRPIACRILAILMARAGQIVPRDELFRRVWHTSDGDSTRALDVHIAYLRRELEADPHQPRLILTERGIGYRLHPPN